MSKQQNPDHCPEPHDIPQLNDLNLTDEETYREAASIFKALGEEGRLKTLILISKQERCVTEIAKILNENLAAVSQRLKLLKSERIVNAKRKGKHIYYSLSDQHIVDLINNGLEHAKE
jgi:ArsR family transcriptional regulator, lead/cadmium/zinc/bismuth-responsive transcriptional repressor